MKPEATRVSTNKRGDHLFIKALTNIDFNVMLGWLLVTAAIVIIFNLIADILYGVLDPRIRHA